MGELEYYKELERLLACTLSKAKSRHEERRVARLLIETENRITRVERPDAYEVSVRRFRGRE